MNDAKIGYLELFDDFINGREIRYSNTYKDSDFRHHVIKAMIAIQNGSIEEFKPSISDIERRKLDENGQWVYDDILLMVFTVGVLKFSLSKKWVNDLCMVRLGHQTGDRKDLTESIHFLLGNSSSGLSYIHVLCRDLSGTESQLSDNSITEGFKAAQDILDKSVDEFFRSVAKATTSSVIKMKGLDNLELTKKKNAFLENFKTQSLKLSKAFFWVLSVGFVLLAIYLSLEFIKLNEGMAKGAWKTLVKDSVTPLISITTLSALFFKRKVIISWINKKIFFLMGGYFPSDFE